MAQQDFPGGGPLLKESVALYRKHASQIVPSRQVMDYAVALVAAAKVYLLIDHDSEACRVACGEAMDVLIAEESEKAVGLREQVRKLQIRLAGTPHPSAESEVR